jgi:hypothetical protein
MPVLGGLEIGPFLDFGKRACRWGPKKGFSGGIFEIFEIKAIPHAPLMMPCQHQRTGRSKIHTGEVLKIGPNPTSLIVRFFLKASFGQPACCFLMA